MPEETESEFPTGKEQQEEHDRKQAELQEAREEHNRRTAGGDPK